MGAGSLDASTRAWISLRGGAVTPRALNVTQLAIAAPALVTAVLVAAWLAGQGRF